MADVVLKIDADTARYIAKIADAADRTKKIGETAGKSIGSAVDIGVTRALLRVELLKKALHAVANVADGITSRAAQSARGTGERAVSLATSLGPLGVPDIAGFTNDLQRAPGLASTDERVAFAKSLADQSASARVPLSPEAARAGLLEYARGGDLTYGTGGKELQEGLARGLSIEEIRRQALARRPGLQNPFLADSDLGRELGVRDTERLSGLSSDSQRFDRGQRTRVGHAVTEERGARGVGAETALGIAEFTGTRGVVDSISGGKDANAITSAIEMQTRELRAANRGLNLTGQGEAGR